MHLKSTLVSLAPFLPLHGGMTERFMVMADVYLNEMCRWHD